MEHHTYEVQNVLRFSSKNSKEYWKDFQKIDNDLIGVLTYQGTLC